MISPEYPPINGGVGRYTYNLVQELKGTGSRCLYNSEILLNLVDKIKPDIVHIQYEPGLYGLKLYSYRPSKIFTTIDSFYEKSPIVTTFH